MSLDKLYEYQELQREHLVLKTRLEKDEKRPALLEWKRRIESMQKEMEQLRSFLNDHDKVTKRLRVSIEETMLKEKSMEKQLYGGKTANPKELMSMQQKLEELVGSRQQAQETLEKEQRQMRRIEEEINLKSSQLMAEVRPYQKAASRYKQERENDKALLNDLMDKIKKVEAELEPELLSIYNKSSKRMGINVLAPMHEGRCSGCNVDVSKVAIAELRCGKKLVNCENCGRIIFIRCV
ncbi:MAG: C4-type zinc ribbon domain-containing protein [Bacillota bacterium]